MPRRIRAASVAPVATLITLALGAPAFAQSETDLAARRTLLDQAQAARAAGDHAQALDLAQRAATIEETPSVRLFIAEEQEAARQFAGALGSADRCSSEVQRDANVPHRDEIVARCSAVATRVRTQLGFVRVRVPANHPAGAQLLVNGMAVNEALWGVDIPVDPGEVRVELRGERNAPSEQRVSVAAGAHVEVTVSVREPEPVATAPVPVVHPENPQTEPQSSGIPVGAVAVAGVGVLAFGAAAVFGVLRNNALAGCTTTPDNAWECDAASLQRAQSDAPLWNDAADVALIAGGVFVAAGAVWFIVDRAGSSSGERRARGRRMLPVLGVGYAGVGGSF